MKTLISFTISLSLCISMCYAKEGFTPYQQGGKWGVLFNGEPCLLPCFEQISDIDKGGRFVYKEKGKWGIANVWRKVTDAFCDSLICINADNPHFCEVYTFTKPYECAFRSYYLFAQQGKWGICHADGVELFPPIYDHIYEKCFGLSDLGFKRKEYIKLWQKNYNCFFLVKINGSYKLIDRFGSEIVSEVPSYDYLFSKEGKKTLSTIIKTIKKAKNNDNAWETWKKDIYESTTPYVLYRSKRDEGKEPRCIYFGCNHDKFFEMQGDTMTISGKKSIVNDYGFISTPLVYDSPYFRLQRNPLDVFSLAELVDEKETELPYGHYQHYVKDTEVTSGAAKRDLILLQRKIKSFTELMDIAKRLGDTDAYNDVKKRKESNQKAYDKYKENYDRAVKVMNFNSSVDKIAGAATSFLNTMMNAVGGSSPNYNTTSSASGTSMGNQGGSTSTSKRMTMTDQVNYNSLRNTYNKWASDLMQMKNRNGHYQNGYNTSDKLHAQSEMKRIRSEAKSKWNKEIPYNSIEDWN